VPSLPKRKVGVVACSGEEMPEGTVTRLAALRVLETLRPGQTVTICLPLFLAGGEGDRAFARYHPTITIDGCEKRCAARSTEVYSGRPAASIVVTEVTRVDIDLGSARRLSEVGMQMVEAVATQIAEQVDRLLSLEWHSRSSLDSVRTQHAEVPEPKIANCACGSGVPVQTLQIGGKQVTLIGLPLIFAQFNEAGEQPDEGTTAELLQIVKIYNPIPDAEEAAYAHAIMCAYTAFCRERH
jgi:uncharacterized metal-binding protein